MNNAQRLQLLALVDRAMAGDRSLGLRLRTVYVSNVAFGHGHRHALRQMAAFLGRYARKWVEVRL